MIKFCVAFAFCVVSTWALAEKWTSAGAFTVPESGRILTINVYGDSDSAVRTGDLSSLMVRGFGFTDLVAQKVMFECVKGEIFWQNGERANIRVDYKGEYALLPSGVMTKLHQIACKKWFEIWK